MQCHTSFLLGRRIPKKTLLTPFPPQPPAPQAQAAKEAVAAAAARQQAEEEEPTAAAPAAPVVIHAMDREGRPIVVGARPAEERGEDVRRRRTGKLKVGCAWKWDEMRAGCVCVCEVNYESCVHTHTHLFQWA